MKKYIIKIICFAAVFAVLWMGADYVLNNDWKLVGSMPVRYEDFENEKELDVLFLGASNIYAGASPAMIWEEAGITSFNFGTRSACPMLFYYQLRYALTKQKPSLVVVDVAGLSTAKDPAGESEMPFRKVYVSLPDAGLKAELLSDMCAHWEDVDPLIYYFPLLRFHERWDQLTEAAFNSELRANSYKDYGKGALYSNKIKRMTAEDDLFRYDGGGAKDVHMEYLEKIYDLCEENDIEMMLVSCPRIKVYYAVYSAAKDFAEKHGLNFVSFTSKEDLDAVGILPEEDFYDMKHMNILGQQKFSVYLADFMKEHYVFEDHSDDKELCTEWDSVYQDYLKYFNKQSVKMLEKLENKEGK